MSTLPEMRAELRALHPVPEELEPLLAGVLLELYTRWNELPPEAREQLDRLRHRLAAALRSAPDALTRGRAVLRFLEALLELDPVVPWIYPLWVQHMAPEASRPVVTLSADEALRLAELAEGPPDELVPRAALREEEARPPEEASTPQEREEKARAIPLHTHVDFPETIPDDPAQEHLLLVQLTQAPQATSRVSGRVTVHFPDPAEPEMVEVRLITPDFVERTGIWSRTIAVYAQADSQPAIFLLRLSRPGAGPRRLTVDLYHRGRNVGTFIVETRVLSSAPPSTRTASAPARPTARMVRGPTEIALPHTPPPPTDVELRVVRSRDGRTLRYILHAPYARLGYHWEDVGSVELPELADPAGYFASLVEALNQRARRPADGHSPEEEDMWLTELKGLGWELYDALFPEALKQEYWRIWELAQATQEQEGRPLSLLITSDEPWIPWELCYPMDPDTGQESDFLAGAFQVTRWLAGEGLRPELAIRAARLIAPEMDLAFVEQEQAYFQELARRRIHVPEPLRRRTQVLALAREGGVQLIHVATHGHFAPENAQESPILLEDGPLMPRDLNPLTARGLRQEHPLIFFNTCHSGRLGFTLTGLGGWAEQLIDQVAVTGFVGSLWEISDELAPLFARSFYQALWAGQPLGRAFHQARMAVRRRQPANPTWLAYTLYGDPNARVRFVGAAP